MYFENGGTFRFWKGLLLDETKHRVCETRDGTRKWTGSQLAMKMGISRMEVSRLLRGKRVGGKKCIGGLIKTFPDAELKDLFFLD